MPATEQISEALIRENITRAVGHVFKTMLGRETTLIPASPAAAPQWPLRLSSPEVARPHVVGTVGFLGDANGLIYLSMDLEFARLCTCHLLGMTPAELTEAGDETINDAIGELTNMTAGVFKNGLCDSGFSCRLTIPSILRGTNFTIDPVTSSTRWIFYFDCSGHRLVVDVHMKPGE